MAEEEKPSKKQGEQKSFSNRKPLLKVNDCVINHD